LSYGICLLIGHLECLYSGHFFVAFGDGDAAFWSLFVYLFLQDLHVALAGQWHNLPFICCDG